MAKQKGSHKIKGTVGDVTYYKMEGVYYARSKSSLDKKRVSKDPSFANSRKSAGIFGQAAALAATIYHALPKEKRKHGLFGKITGRINTLLHEGLSEVQVMAKLKKELAK